MIPQKLIDKYKEENKRQAGYVDTLNKYSVVGFETQRDMDIIIAWLEKHKIKFEKNDRFLIWIETLKESIKQSLRKP